MVAWEKKRGCITEGCGDLIGLVLRLGLLESFFLYISFGSSQMSDE